MFLCNMSSVCLFRVWLFSLLWTIIMQIIMSTMYNVSLHCKIKCYLALLNCEVFVLWSTAALKSMYTEHQMVLFSATICTPHNKSLNCVKECLLWNSNIWNKNIYYTAETILTHVCWVSNQMLTISEGKLFLHSTSKGEY